MDFGDSQDLATFRLALRAWLPANRLERRAGEPDPAYLQRWHQQLFAGGWVGVAWPVEYGGKGLSASYDAVVNEEVGAAGAPAAPRIGYLGRSILEYGTDEQKQRYLPALLRGDTSWCQGFSEPDAGSDLANMSTRALRDGPDYVIDGQKVWTSYADHAELCLLIARTGPQSDRHRGITAFIVPMDSAGFDVRPMLASNGDTEFSEIFLNRVRVPAEQRLGEEGQGWAIAMLTVSYERGAADVGYLSRFGTALVELKDALGPERLANPAVAQEFGRQKMHYEVLRQHVRRRMVLREHAPEVVPGPEMSIDKMLMTKVDQSLHDAAVRLLGPAALDDSESGSWLKRYLYSRGASIYGGSEQMQYNIIAQRLLGLPR